MSLIDILTNRRQSARPKLLELARKEAAGKAGEKDADSLAALLADAEMSPSEYAQAVAAVREAEALRAEVAKLPALERAHIKAAAALNEYDTETRRIADARQAERWTKAEIPKREAYSAVQAAKRAAWRLAELEESWPKLFATEPVDLDAFTLVHREDMVGPSDPEAPVRMVGRETYTRERERRFRIMRHAHQEAQNEHAAEFEAWAKKQPRNFAGHLLSTEGAPERPDVTWALVMARGWNRSLDRTDEPEPTPRALRTRQAPIAAA